MSALLAERDADVVDAEGGYALPFPVLSGVDAAALAAVLEDGVAAAWVRVLDQAAETVDPRAGRRLAGCGRGPGRGLARRGGPDPVTRAFPGLPES